MKRKVEKNNAVLMISLAIGLVIFIFLFYNWPGSNANFDSDVVPATLMNERQHAAQEKQKGAHVFGQLDAEKMRKILDYNINWITMVSWGAQEDIDSESLRYTGSESLDNRRRDSTWLAQIELAHSVGLKVFFKPHVWIVEPADGKWRSDIFPKSEAQWQIWKEDYREFILTYAEIAQRGKVELFCVGTELSRLSVEYAEYWRSLIQEVRSIYDGKLTYAANWYQEYEDITFWDELDYIGIQAYFPLVQHNFPSTADLTKGWNKNIPAMKTLAKKTNRKILFTELGYKSSSDSGIEPWVWVENVNEGSSELSFETQSNCYQAFFDSVWREEWLAGVHFWQFDTRYIDKAPRNKMDFSPQGKPAAQIIAKGFEWDHRN